MRSCCVLEYRMTIDRGGQQAFRKRCREHVSYEKHGRGPSSTPSLYVDSVSINTDL
jgi:hypothetical protein